MMTQMRMPFEYARKKLIYCRLSDPMTSLAKIFEDENVGSALVKDANGEYIGMVTDSMIFRAIGSGVNVTQLKVSDLKLEPLVKVDKNADVGEVLEALKNTTTNRVVMVDSKGKIVGVIKKTVVDRLFRFEVGSRMTRKH
ncbi:MAG: CBS domain-containing protein [Candidatus Altiarchaeota archaeon]